MQFSQTPALYVVGTPIGNLSDLSPRGVETLGRVDFIAAEDTRVTLKLLNFFEIKKPLVSYFEHNKQEKGEQICARILAGESCALVTDAGMPAISDPGQELVELCVQKGIPVVAVPGPTAFATALAVSGLPSGRFTFEGFLSVNKRSRTEHLASLVQEERTMLFYEAPHKLLSTLQDLLQALGDRRIALVRELTKLHEQVQRTTLAQAVQYYTQNQPRGEFVLVVEGAPRQESEPMTLDGAVALAKEKMEEGMAASAAAKYAAAASGMKKGDIYRQL